MFTTKDYQITNIEHETKSEAIWIDRIDMQYGKLHTNCVPVAPWGDADAMVTAAKKIARLTF